MRPQDKDSTLAAEVSVKRLRHKGFTAPLDLALFYPFLPLSHFKPEQSPTNSRAVSLFSDWIGLFLEWGEGQIVF